MTKGAEVAGQNASDWIHLYAITIGLFVILPRLFFALLWRVKAAALTRTLPFRDVSGRYYEHLLATSTGDSIEVTIVPYCMEPDDMKSGPRSARSRTSLRNHSKSLGKLR